jgi:hypothetical protein
VQFKIEPNLGACGRNRAHNFRAFRGIKLQPDFEKRDLIAQLFNSSSASLFVGTSSATMMLSAAFVIPGEVEESLMVNGDVSTPLDMTIEM